jgi:hypothetical protein
MPINKIKAGSIDTGSITSAKIAADAVTSAKIANDTIANADISSSAAIAYSKLNLATSIANADISSSAAIAYSKLNLGTSITSSDLASTVITGATAEATVAGGDQILIYDDSASALRKMTRTNFVSGVGGVNTPAFNVTKTNALQYIANNTETKVQFTNILYDTNNCFDSTTNYRFTPTTAGKYFFSATLSIYAVPIPFQDFSCFIKKNNSTHLAFHNFFQNSGNQLDFCVANVSAFDNANGSTDYYECFVYYNYTSGSGSNFIDNSRHNINFGGFKLIE